MKLKFALVLFALLFGAIAVDEVLGGDDKHTSTPASTESPVEPTTPKPGPVPDEQKDYILSFMSYGLNMTEDNLFNYASKKAPKLKPIFNYTKGTNEHFATVEQFATLSDQIEIYKNESDLNSLLDAENAAKSPGNYSYQLYHSSYYGRVSAETVLSMSKYKSTLATKITKELFTKEFVDEVGKLVGNSTSKYHIFLAKYGMFYFTSATFGGMVRIQTHTTNKFVRDVSKDGFEEYLRLQLNQTFNLVAPLPYDFFYHCYSENSTFGGDKTINISETGAVGKWVKNLIESTDPDIVPIDFEYNLISNLMNVPDLLPPGADVAEIIEGLDSEIQIELDIFKVKSYMEAMDVVRNNPYGRSLGGSFDAQFLYSYFEDKLKEDSIDIENEDFEDNAWAAKHNAQAILNRRGWFEKPYPPEPTTLAPTTEPTKPANATEAAATTEATTKKA